MKIVAKRKDYYDYVAALYGGGDPKNTYERGHYVIPWVYNETLDKEIENPFLIPSKLVLWLPRRYSHTNYAAEYRGLFVAGRYYVFGRTGTAISSTDGYLWGDWYLLQRADTNKRRWAFLGAGDTFVQGATSMRGTEISKIIKQPIFFINGDGPNQWVPSEMPYLSEWGFPSRILAEQLYQELALFVSSVLQPVEGPAATQSDVQKAEAHGFDKRQSFRHRK